MDLSKLYALLNAVPIVTGGAQAVMDAIMQKNMTFPQAVAERINAPFRDLSFEDFVAGKGDDLPFFELPTRDFQPLPEYSTGPSYTHDEIMEMDPDDYMARVEDRNDNYWHEDDDWVEHPPNSYYKGYTPPVERKRMARYNNQLFRQYPKLLEAFKTWRSK